jgi:hypothetical protein
LIIKERWHPDIFKAILQIREMQTHAKICEAIGRYGNQRADYILSFQVNQQLNITFFSWEARGESHCLLGPWEKGQQSDIISRIFKLLEHSRQELIRQWNIPTRIQVEALSELIRNTCFVKQINQTVLCEWSPIALVPDRDLWRERQQILQEAEADFKDSLEANMIGMDLEHYDWQEWDSTEYLERITRYFETVSFFIPSFFLQLEHDNFRFQAALMEENWGKIVYKMKTRYFETCSPDKISELEIPADFPVDSLVNTLGYWNEFKVNGQPAANQLSEENMLIEMTARFPMNEFTIMGRIFRPAKLQKIKGLFRRTLLIDWERSLQNLRSTEFEIQLQEIHQDRYLLAEITAHTNQINHQIFLTRWWTHQGLEFIFLIQSAIPSITTKITNDLSSWDITKEFTGMSEATRMILHERLQQPYQGKQDWIKFGQNPTIVEPTLAEQANLFPQIGFEVEAEIPSLFKLKQLIIRDWQKSLTELFMAYREEPL